jgi:small subunit ribosomal protein S20
LAHGKSAKKRIRQNAARRLRNRQAKSALRTTVKKLAAAAAGDATAAFRGVQKKLDQAVAKGIVRKGTADRMKSRLAARLAAKAPKK